MIQQVQDTFLHYLADNLTEYVIAPRRQVAGVSNQFKDNAINVEFLNVSFGNVADQQVVLDIIYSNESDAAETLSALWDLFRQSFYTPLMDYTNPGDPVPVGNLQLVVNRDKMRFMRVSSPTYCHYTAQLSLGFVAV